MLLFCADATTDGPARTARLAPLWSAASSATAGTTCPTPASVTTPGRVTCVTSPSASKYL